MELGSTVPCGNGRRPGTRNHASGQQVKLHTRITPRTRLQTPPRHTGTPSCTTRVTMGRILGSTGYWNKNQVFRGKKQGLDRKPGKQEMSQKIGRRDIKQLIYLFNYKKIRIFENIQKLNFICARMNL